MLPEDKVIYTRRYHRTNLRLDGKDVVPFDVKVSLEQFKKRLEGSRLELKEARVEGGKRFISKAKDFAVRNCVDVDITQRLYYIEVSFHGLGGAYPKTFSREFSELMNICDRFDLCVDEKTDSVTFSLEYDTHDFYFGDKIFNEIW